jgi:hypothetical protein
MNSDIVILVGFGIMAIMLRLTFASLFRTTPIFGCGGGTNEEPSLLLTRNRLSTSARSTFFKEWLCADISFPRTPIPSNLKNFLILAFFTPRETTFTPRVTPGPNSGTKSCTF